MQFNNPTSKERFTPKIYENDNENYLSAAFAAVIAATGAETVYVTPRALFVPRIASGDNGGGFIYQTPLLGCKAPLLLVFDPAGYPSNTQAINFWNRRLFSGSGLQLQQKIVKITPGGVQSTFAKGQRAQF